jgi:hypothetical protein
MKNAKKNNKFFDTAKALCEQGLTMPLHKLGLIRRTCRTVVKNHHSLPSTNPYAKWPVQCVPTALIDLFFCNEEK